jgi:hypothetical protein
VAISVTDLTNNISTAGATLTLALTSIPAGAAIILGAGEYNTQVVGTLSDGTNGAYTNAKTQSNAAPSVLNLFYFLNSAAFTGTATFTKGLSGSNATIQGVYATGIATASALDAAVTAGASSASANPPVINLASGTPGVSGELFVGISGGQTNGTVSTWTPDTGNGWNTPAPFAMFQSQVNSNAAHWQAGGYQVNAGSAAKTFHPTLTAGNGARTADTIIVGFKATAVAAVTSLAEIQSFQPPAFRGGIRGALLRGHDGIEAPLLGWRNMGWEVQPPQPPAFRRGTKAASFLRGDEGTQRPFEFWRNAGWEIQSVQPPAAQRGRKGAGLKGDDGTHAPFVFWRNTGWEIQPYQPPAARRGTKGAGLKGDDGIQATFQPWLNAGWEVQPYQPPAFRRGTKGAPLKGDEGTQAVYVSWVNAGWEVQPYQPPANLRGAKGAEQAGPGAHFLPIWRVSPTPDEFTGERRPLYLRGTSFWKGRS